ncbi:NUDIX domain-containing protein [Streptomyces prasinus]|uniref:NUDIX domain-containing protein n=1 Tax=Streptomyces prasinus TaxID=67345 RepID=UPI0036A2F289
MRVPGHYAVASGGAVAAGESDEEAASREPAEETGVRAPVRFIVRFLNRDGLGPHRLAVHEAVLFDHPNPDPDEVVWQGRLFEGVAACCADRRLPAGRGIRGRRRSRRFASVEPAACPWTLPGSRTAQTVRN